MLYLPAGGKLLLKSGAFNFFCKGPEGKYYRFCGHNVSVTATHSTLLCQGNSGCRPDINNEHRCVPKNFMDMRIWISHFHMSQKNNRILVFFQAFKNVESIFNLTIQQEAAGHMWCLGHSVLTSDKANLKFFLPQFLSHNLFLSLVGLLVKMHFFYDIKILLLVILTCKKRRFNLKHTLKLQGNFTLVL